MKTMTAAKFDWLQDELEILKEQNLYRQFRVLEQIKATQAKLNGRALTLFCGNDYLGLSQHPKLIQAAQEVSAEYGIGTGSARLISGTTRWHTELEERIAKFLGKERALVFSSGYLANLGALTALVQKNDLVLLDKLSHASLIDAAQYSKGKLRIFPHSNLDYLEKILKSSNEERKWIVTDSIFSMDGDLAQLEKLTELKNRYGAYLILDEAHGTGVFGKNGKGVSEHFNVMDQVDVHIGTLSKAVGSFGGFVAGPKEIVDYLINHARPFIFETALPPAICQAAVCGLELIAQEPELRARLWNNVKLMRSKLAEIKAPLLEGDSPIIPVIFGDEKKALRAAQFFLDNGFLVPAVRYPTVAKGKARIRITVSAAHQETDIARFVKTVKAFSD